MMMRFKPTMLHHKIDYCGCSQNKKMFAIEMKSNTHGKQLSLITKRMCLHKMFFAEFVKNC